MSSKELDLKLVRLVNDLEELSQAVSRASVWDDSEELAKLLEKRTELKLSVKKLR